MKLITDISEKTKGISEQSETGEKSYFLEGVFMQAEQRNRNGRIYEKAILKDALDQYIEEQIKTNRAVGELNHPASPTINYKEVSHKIESLDWDGNDVIGRAKILNTPNGVIAKSLIDGGVQLGVSSRGMGSISKRESIDYVNKDFVLNTVDIVQDPSAPHAYVNPMFEGAFWNNGIMEGIEWEMKNGELTPVNINNINNKEIELQETVSVNESSKYFALRQFLQNLSK